MSFDINSDHLIRIVLDLAGEDGHPEYSRACAEILCDALHINMDHKGEVLNALRITKGVI